MSRTDKLKRGQNQIKGRLGFYALGSLQNTDGQIGYPAIGTANPCGTAQCTKT